MSKIKIIMKNDYAFIKVAGKFCELFTHLTCRWHEIKYRRQYCLTNPHILW